MQIAGFPTRWLIFHFIQEEPHFFITDNSSRNGLLDTVIIFCNDIYCEIKGVTGVFDRSSLSEILISDFQNL